MDIQKMDTAYYVFDIGILKKRVAYLRSRLPQSVQLCYAVKANTFLIQILAGEVERFEICSPGEAVICEKMKVPDHQMVISGVYKTPAVMQRMAELEDDRIFTVESAEQFELFLYLSKKRRKKIPLLLRMTNNSQFGMNPEEIKDIIKCREEYPELEIRGVQFFSGTQKNSVKKIKRELNHLDILLSELKELYGYEAQELEYGPGLPIAYFKEDEIDEELLLAGLTEAIQEMVNTPRIVLELGRSIAAGCGSYYTHVVDKKTNGGQNYLLLDGGMHQLAYFGQHMAMKQPFLRLCGEKADRQPEIIYHLCGSLCSMNDILAKQVLLPETEIGDLICFENTGAYCITEGIALFLSRELPAVFIKTEAGTYRCVREPVETADLNMPDEKS